jgi:hypothetical protein
VDSHKRDISRDNDGSAVMSTMPLTLPPRTGRTSLAGGRFTGPSRWFISRGRKGGPRVPGGGGPKADRPKRIPRSVLRSSYVVADYTARVGQHTGEDRSPCRPRWRRAIVQPHRPRGPATGPTGPMAGRGLGDGERETCLASPTFTTTSVGAWRVVRSTVRRHSRHRSPGSGWLEVGRRRRVCHSRLTRSPAACYPVLICWTVGGDRVI